MVLFDWIKGFPLGYRVSPSMMGGIRRTVLGLGLAPLLSNVDLVRGWKVFNNCGEPTGRRSKYSE